jgi:hypothetical protein
MRFTIPKLNEHQNANKPVLDSKTVNETAKELQTETVNDTQHCTSVPLSVSHPKTETIIKTVVLKPQKPCKYCNQLFEYKRENAKFCSVEHKNAWHRENGGR